MERATKSWLVLTLLLTAFLVNTEGGRDVPMKNEVYSPQSFFGPFGFGLPFGPSPFFKPWFGLPCCGGLPGLFPFQSAPKAAAGLKDMAKANAWQGEVAKADDVGASAAQSP